MIAAAAGLGLLIGLVMGGLGGGGGVLVVPALVYLLGQSAQDATTGSVVIVGVAAVGGVLTRVRGGIDWRTGLSFGALGIPAAYLGARLNQHVAQPVVLLSFATLTLLTATGLLLDTRRRTAAEECCSTPTGDRAGGAPLRTLPPRLHTAAKVAGCGLTVGFLTGFLGVGGGFLVVPALVIVVRMPMRLAVGTSLMIIVLNSASSFVSRLGAVSLDWRVIVPFTVGAVVSCVAAKSLAHRLSGTTLTRAFAILLVAVGAFVAVQNLLAL
jgi:uncharacterized membrane protein YfcA